MGNIQPPPAEVREPVAVAISMYLAFSVEQRAQFRETALDAALAEMKRSAGHVVEMLAREGRHARMGKG